MRVLIIPDPSRGDEEFTRALAVADYLRARGHLVWVFPDSVPSLSRKQRTPERLSLWKKTKHICQLLQTIRRHHIQIVHTSGVADRATRVAARLTSAALVTTSFAAKGSAGVSSPHLPIDCDEWHPLETMYRSAFVKTSGREIPVLCYHRLVENNAERGKFDTHIHIEVFEEHLRFLRDNRYRTLLFSDLTPATVFNEHERSVVLTFDDGYEDNYRLLLPLLRKYDAKAVIFLVSGCDDNQWDIAKGERPLRLLNNNQRREMLASGLIEFGAHTVSHPDLSELTPAQAAAEIVQSKRDLEADLKMPLTAFAYPYGRLNEATKAAVRAAGFRYGIATHSGPIAMHEDPFEMRRIVVFPNTPLTRFRRKVSGRYAMRSSRREANKSPQL